MNPCAPLVSAVLLESGPRLYEAGSPAMMIAFAAHFHAPGHVQVGAAQLVAREASMPPSHWS
jgi:hypothetical protein